MTLADAGLLTERTLELGETTRRFRCAIDQHLFPFSNAVETIFVETTDTNAVQITWRSDFEIEESLAPKVDAMIAAFYSAAIDSLLAYCAGAAPKEALA